jgi:hypothetical protein
MTVFVLIAFLHNDSFLNPGYSPIQLEFKSLKSCETGKEVLKKKYNYTTLNCVEFTK